MILNLLSFELTAPRVHGDHHGQVVNSQLKQSNQIMWMILSSWPASG